MTGGRHKKAADKYQQFQILKQSYFYRFSLKLMQLIQTSSPVKKVLSVICVIFHTNQYQ